MQLALQISQMVISFLPTILSMFEQVLGATHPDVVAAKAAADAISQAHSSAVSATQAQ